MDAKWMDCMQNGIFEAACFDSFVLWMCKSHLNDTYIVEQHLRKSVSHFKWCPGNHVQRQKLDLPNEETFSNRWRKSHEWRFSIWNRNSFLRKSIIWSQETCLVLFFFFTSFNNSFKSKASHTYHWHLWAPRKVGQMANKRKQRRKKIEKQN